MLNKTFYPTNSIAYFGKGWGDGKGYGGAGTGRGSSSPEAVASGPVLHHDALYHERNPQKIRERLAADSDVFSVVHGSSLKAAIIFALVRMER
jgi:hypothetical protein